MRFFEIVKRDPNCESSEIERDCREYFISRTELMNMIIQSRSRDKRNGLTRTTGVNTRLRGLRMMERSVKMLKKKINEIKTLFAEGV